ncbi:hypothetical protein [Paenibacillus glycinis]|uniref:Uncharacterized protein n=1 Tax=Paenibacillus glycinis TaxID=2697035 RepID=A0ABW9XXY5_9BACL|nr:hypothetical protein [Paenibacillus glycinis]NBD27499.1 hypothetical protein [Paenibacillus glycinis]
MVAAVALGDANVEADADIAAVAEDAGDTNAGETTLVEETDNFAVRADQFFDDFAVSAADGANELGGNDGVFQLAEQIAQIGACLLNSFDRAVPAVAALMTGTDTPESFVRHLCFAGLARADCLDVLHFYFSGHLNSSFLRANVLYVRRDILE